MVKYWIRSTVPDTQSAPGSSVKNCRMTNAGDNLMQRFKENPQKLKNILFSRSVAGGNSRTWRN